MSISVLNTDAGLSGTTLVNAESAQTVTGLKLFDRDPNAPFSVSASSAVVTNLDADKWDGQDYVSTISWTPTLTFDVPGNLNVIYSGQSGKATKIGQLVIASATVSCSTFTHTTAAGGLRINGVPYVAAGGMEWTGAALWNGITRAGYTDVVAVLTGGTQSIALLSSGSGVSPATLSTGDIPSGGSVAAYFTIMYVTA